MSIKGFAIYFDNVYPVDVIDIEEDYLNVKFGPPRTAPLLFDLTRFSTTKHPPATLCVP